MISKPMVTLSRYDITYYENLDFTRKNKIKIYEPIEKKEKSTGIVGSVPEFSFEKKGTVLFDFTFEPLFENKIFKEKYCHINLGEELYNTLSHIYFSQYLQCMHWYVGIDIVKNAFNFEQQIEKYEKLINDQEACPIVSLIRKDKLDNVLFEKQFRELLRYAALKDIHNVNELLYGKQNPRLKQPYNASGEKIVNCIINIVYQRFLFFLKTKESKVRIQTNDVNDTLLASLERESVDLLHQLLIRKNYISPISLSNFQRCLSGINFSPGHRIKWKQSKSKCYYLFEKICRNFSVKKLNASVKSPKGEFDSNNQPKHGYIEIDELIENCKNRRFSDFF
jgi:hypothetical protein